ncbi:protocadherin Fat 1 [Trichonephila clavipes]|nr:protocadherin Fat 1 [Trichonephila clavipes]
MIFGRSEVAEDDDRSCRSGISRTEAEDRWCSCPANFTGRYCDVDVDECQFTDACSEHEVCQNTYGSYKCFCEEGFVRDGYKCIPDGDMMGWDHGRPWICGILTAKIRKNSSWGNPGG